MFGLYNGIFQIKYLSKIKNNKEESNAEKVVVEEVVDELPEESLEVESDEQATLDEECEEIRSRPIVVNDIVHEVVELVSDNKILMGPPTLTRFEKARIMGARALQLSLGAPPFIDIPENATTSLDIAMEELDQRVIPITIRRVNPNGDFQNIPLFNFK